MPANLIIFDADYVSELTSKMNEACTLVDEAVAALKQASLHEGWKCKENTRISADLDDLNIRLGRLDNGVNETVRVLGGSISRFAELEAKYETQANSLSDDLTNNYGFQASTHESSRTSGEMGGYSAHSGNPSASGGGPGVHASAGAGVGGVAGIGGNHIRMNMPNVNTNQAMTNDNVINLPVTHIPDRPEAAAKGIKDTQKILDTAVDSVAVSITNALTGRVKVSMVAPDGSDSMAQNLVDAYNAGKIVSENSALIISNPAMPHTEERLAMAAGLVTLAGSAAAMSSDSSTLAHTPITDNKLTSISANAKKLLPAMANISNSGELSNVLNTVSSGEKVEPSSKDSSSEDKDSVLSFFEKVITSLLSMLAGQSSEVTSENSPVQEFLSSFISD